MCAYNRINGTYCSENTHLLQDILGDEFGFKGLLMSDWGAVLSIKGLGHGLDLDMPDAGEFLTPAAIQGALTDGSLTMDELDGCVRRFLTLIVSKGFMDRPQKRADLPLDSPASSALALDVAREAMVLLKNQDGTLPLHRSAIHRIAGFWRHRRPHSDSRLGQRALPRVSPGRFPGWHPPRRGRGHRDQLYAPPSCRDRREIRPPPTSRRPRAPISPSCAWAGLSGKAGTRRLPWWRTRRA